MYNASETRSINVIYCPAASHQFVHRSRTALYMSQINSTDMNKREHHYIKLLDVTLKDQTPLLRITVNAL